MSTTYRRVCVAAFAALLLALPTATAGAAQAPIASCGNTSANGVLISDISARRVSCKVARRIARLTPERCESGQCTVRGYTCLTAEATDELTFARCSKARDGEELYRTVRFDYGS